MQGLESGQNAESLDALGSAAYHVEFIIHILATFVAVLVKLSLNRESRIVHFMQ